MNNFDGDLVRRSLAPAGEDADEEGTARRKARFKASIAKLKTDPSERARIDAIAASVGIKPDEPGGDIKGGRFPWWARGRRRAAPEIKRAPADWIVRGVTKGGRFPWWARGRRRAAPEIKRAPATADSIVRGVTIAIAGVIAAVLVWWAYIAQPVQLADVTTQLNPSLYLEPFAVTGGGHVDHGNIPLQVTGMLTEAAGFVSALELDTRPSGEPSWQKQTACCTLLGSAFTGSASLSVASAQAFDFQLVSAGNNTVLATGTLTVHLESFPGGSQQAINIIAGLGAAAVLLEFLRFVSRLFRRPTGPEPAPLTKQGEPDA